MSQSMSQELVYTAWASNAKPIFCVYFKTMSTDMKWNCVSVCARTTTFKSISPIPWNRQSWCRASSVAYPKPSIFFKMKQQDKYFIISQTNNETIFNVPAHNTAVYSHDTCPSISLQTERVLLLCQQQDIFCCLLLIGSRKSEDFAWHHREVSMLAYSTMPSTTPLVPSPTLNLCCV